MSDDRSTKDRILDAAQTIMLEKSFHSVGLNEILKSEEVTKGSFYHHFESKEQFGVELLQHYITKANAYKRRMLLSSEPEANPRNRIITFLESSIASFMSNEGKCPCLVLKLTNEVSDFSDPMRQVLVEGAQEGIAITESVIREGLQKKTLRCELDSHTTAVLISDLWIGAMQRASVERSSEPLRTALGFITDKLLCSPI